MPESKNYVFEHTELAEILIKKLDLHEGLWGVYFEFGLGAGNVATGPDGKAVMPAAINFVNKVGIQKFDAPNNLTVDAAQVNPAPGQTAAATQPAAAPPIAHPEKGKLKRR